MDALISDDATSLHEVFTKGKAGGNLKNFYYAETFETGTKDDSAIWANGSNLVFETGKFLTNTDLLDTTISVGWVR